jgi:hypothetical protein
MEAMSPVFAALGVTGYDALDDLAHWLDGSLEPAAGGEMAGWAKSLSDAAMRAAFGAGGREG